MVWKPWGSLSTRDRVLHRVGRLFERVGRRLRSYHGCGEVWIDVGAHLGEKTFPFAEKDPSITVYAFEPNLGLATQRIGLLPNFVVIPMAVAERDGSADFYISTCDAASSLLPFNPEGLHHWISDEKLEVERKISVPVIRLDTFMGLMGISQVEFLKIDAQGADQSVVKSAGRRIRDIRMITLEVQTSQLPLYCGASDISEVEDYLQKAGFVMIQRERQSHDQEENLTFVNGSFSR